MKTKNCNQRPTTLLDVGLIWLRLVLVSVAVVLVLRATVARAEMPTAPSATGQSGIENSSEMKVKRDARGRKMQYVDFSDALIEGRARTPDGFVIQSRNAGRFKSMIELRSNFRDNIKVHALEAGSAIGIAD
ncbi:MAG: hypothetical protein RLZZ488_1185 [Pseudomonadota bacterium]|jgi:hypothetical protein